MKSPILHDIKPLIAIPDDSFILLIEVVVGVLILCGVAIFWVYRYRHQRQENTPLVRWKEKILNVNLDDPKATAYTLTKWGRYGHQDEEIAQLYTALVERLFPYKYHKVVPPFDPLTRQMIQTFLHEVRRV